MREHPIEFRGEDGRTLRPTPLAMPHSAKSSPSNRRIELYTQEPMVNWLGPFQLTRTDLQSAVATTMGAFADLRDVLAMLNPRDSHPPIQLAGDGEVWADYLADTGDGWDSTYSMAWCVSHDVELPEHQLTLPRADVLLLGCDQVYPTPAQSGSGELELRLIEPPIEILRGRITP